MNDSMCVRVYPSMEELPLSYGRLLDDASRSSFFLSALWFRHLVATATPPANEVRLYGLESNEAEGEALALLVTRAPPRKSRILMPRTLEGFASVHSVLFGPVLSNSLNNPKELIRRLIEAAAAERPAWDVISLKALDRHSPVFDHLLEALRCAGFITQAYFHFANIFERLDGQDFEAFLQARGSAIRQTLMKKNRKLGRSGQCEFRLVSGEDGVEAGMAAYATIYQNSWKGPEEFPGFIPSLARGAARSGKLRLGVLYWKGEPAATQLCFLSDGRASMFKTAYDERFSNLGVGNIVILRTLQHVVDVDRVTEVDFGIGDQPYKSDWLSQRRERWGIMAFNSRSPLGLALAARHVGGRVLKHNLKNIKRTNSERIRLSR